MKNQYMSLGPFLLLAFTLLILEAASPTPPESKTVHFHFIEPDLMTITEREASGPQEK